MMKRFVLLLALAACARELRSTNPDNWLELQSEHFVLRTDLPQEDARKAVADLELVRNALLAAGWSSPHPSPTKIVVVALAGGRELREFLSEREVGATFYGFFGERVVLVDGEADFADSRIVKHEATHALAFDLLVSNPRWVQEGLACYLETLEIDRSKGQATRGKADWHRLDYLRFHPPERPDRSGLHPPVEWSLQILGPDSARSSMDGWVFETLSWVLVHWLVDTDAARFNRFLTRLAHGESMWSAFNGIYPELDEPRLGAELHAYLFDTSKMRRASFQFQPWSGKIAVRGFPAAEMHALRAELFLGGSAGTSEERRRSFDKEIALSKAVDPANPLALALGESDPSLAIQAHPDDWRAWLLWHDKNRDDIASIRKAADLDRNAIVLAMLALAEQKRGEKEAALRHAEEALRISPRFFQLDALAQIYDGNGRCEEAVTAEQRALDALSDGASSSLLARLRKRLTDISARCGKRDPAGSTTKKVEAEPVLKSCRQPMRIWQGQANGVTSEFTIREDGSVTAVVIKGARDEDLARSLRRFLESCTFEPVMVDGRVRQLQATIDLGEFMR